MNHHLPFRIGSLLNDQEQLSKLKLLIVGVGGIGCELLKVLCKMPIGSIHIIDMDTIEISNLNRQFLFKAQHKGHSKALVAKETIKKLNPHLHIEAHHKNIKQFPVSFFRNFNFLIMALDNIQTRNYVNRIGIRLNIPTIDAGTLGYKGNVHIIIPHKTRCYSCEPKVNSQKSFPVCTIRMRPQKPIHCIVWAKMLFQVLFSGQQNNDMKDLAILAEKGDQNSLLKQLLHNEIINIKNAKTDSDNKLTLNYIAKIKPLPIQLLHQTTHIKLQDFDAFQSNKIDINTLVSLAKQSFSKLLQQKQKDGSVLFQKDDDLIIIFISSLANLRMMCFSIQQQSFNEVKNMAGNIVPAIASTNSIVSGLQVIEMIKLVGEEQQSLRSYYVQNQNYKVRALRTEVPIANCSVCSESAKPVIFELDMQHSNFKLVVQKLQQQLQQNQNISEFSINLGSKQLYNSEEPNHKILQKKLIQISGGAYQLDLMIIDEDASQKICTLWIVHNEHRKQPQIHSQNQIQHNIRANAERKRQAEKQAQRQHEKQMKAIQQQQDEDDCGFVEVQKNGQAMQQSDQIQIVEVKKPQKQEHEQVEDKVEKRVKY